MTSEFLFRRTCGAERTNRVVRHRPIGAARSTGPGCSEREPLSNQLRRRTEATSQLQVPHQSFQASCESREIPGGNQQTVDLGLDQICRSRMTVKATTARPVDIASTRTFGNPSNRDDRAKISAAAIWRIAS